MSSSDSTCAQADFHAARVKFTIRKIPGAGHVDAIEGIASKLTRSRPIRRHSGKKVTLARVRQTPIHAGPVRLHRFQEFAEPVTAFLPINEEV